jgi:hypothetical protein
MPKQGPTLLAKFAVDKVFTRYQQALQSVAEDLGLEDLDEDVLIGALHNYSDIALDQIARETANIILREGRAEGLSEAAAGEEVVWRRSAVLDDKTCDACDAADGEEIDDPDEDLSDICEGGGNCRCIPFAELP